MNLDVNDSPVLIFVTAVTYGVGSSCYYARMKRPLNLQVYVTDDCWSCRESRRIVADVSPQFPNLSVELRDLDGNQPDNIFAVPTYVLNGRIIYLGNPTREELKQKLTTISQSVEI